MLEPFPTAAQAVCRHARERPNAIAVEEDGLKIPYSGLHADLSKIVPMIRELGLDPKRDRVAVEWAGLYRHWIVLMAFEALGIPTSTFLPPPMAIDNTKALLRLSTFALYASPLSGFQCPAQRMDAEWWERATAQVPESVPEEMPEDGPVRLVCTSGTTGMPKVMMPTRSQISFRRRAVEAAMGFTPESRYLVNLSFFVQAEYRRAHMCLAAGGTCVTKNRPSLTERIAAASPTHLALFPKDVDALLSSPGATAGMTGLHIWIVGGRLPEALQDALRRAGVASLHESYSSNESGALANVTREGVLEPVPGVDFEIVREDGSAVGPDEAGQVRVRSPGIVDRRIFFDGRVEELAGRWFYPGDLGIVSADSEIRILGRSDDVLNLGGVKLHAPLIEAWIRSLDGVRDAALATRPNGDRSERLCLFLVADGDTPLEAVETSVRQKLEFEHGPLDIRRVPELPRGPTGKLQRRVLGEMARGA